MASNPSHLEAVDPVVEGMVRAHQDRIGDRIHEKVLPVLLHGDAAFAGQGVVAETLNLSQLRGYRTGGTVHIVINNQIGFTTRPDDLRSSLYSTDVAKMVRAPIFHVNGDHPEEAVRVIHHALAFRQRFKQDVVVDLVCYRRWGHNEGDDPSYTNPVLYGQIESHRSVRKLYTEHLVRRGDFDIETAEKALEDFRERLREVHDEVRALEAEPATLEEPIDEHSHYDAPTELRPASAETLRTVLESLDRVPPGFEVHPKLSRQLAQRKKRFDGDTIDWGLAEALAFGSLVLDGVPVRLSGEDSGRGTFSQRHAVLHDQRSADQYVPLSNLSPDQAPFNVYDSLLSEFAVLGFEYGYSVGHPEALVMWEAQFGDFCNGAQVIIDQFISSAESKWGQTSSVVLLLPHGYEGQGPEHSSARLERFLQVAARRNVRVVYPSTPAQYFHLLRTQVQLEVRKPLVVMTPKSLLRLPACVSSVADLTDGAFHTVIEDDVADPASVRRLVLCSGKLYFELLAERSEAGVADTAITRVELLYPFPSDALASAFGRYPALEEIVWAQEEPRNMGAWSHAQDWLRDVMPEGVPLRYAGRARSASTATGSHRRHVREQRRLVREALGLAEDV
jgi:2-oxoglutarate dehydrogenase E1 component